MSGDTLHEPADFQDGERRENLLGREPGLGDQLIDGNRLIAEVAEQRSLLVGERQFGGMADGGFVDVPLDLADERAEFLQNVVDRFDELRAVAEQFVAASAGQAVHRPGTAKTSRFCSTAWRAVESEPLRGVASITTTPRHKPLTIRLRCGKSWASGR